jgi:AGCS family alanine or glycine:cation symporter
MFDTIINGINSILWGYVLVYGLLGVGVFFTIRLAGIQFRHFGEMFRVVGQSRSTDAAGISPFQALMVSLASRVGTGNLAGVAVALSLGGAGAIFWIWVVALVGMATAYAESTLGQLYKTTNDAGEYRGGPAFYIARGLKSRWAAAVFSISLLISFGLVFNAVQANTVADAMRTAFNIPTFATGIVIAVAAGVVIFGGIRQVARVAGYLVPFMAIVYVLMAVGVLLFNLPEVPGALWRIITGAFGLNEAAGGLTGGLMVALLNGVKRGLFSNEAGMGSAPNIAACVTPQPHHPSSQGFVQALGVFIDTIVICTATALVILLSGAFEPGTGADGIALTQNALAQFIGPAGPIFIAVAILLFAFTSIIGNYTYAENTLTYLGLGGHAGRIGLRIALLAMVLWGSLQSIARVFNTADAAMGIMATVNLVAIVLLSGTVVKLTRDYFTQRRRGDEPAFHGNDYPELADQIEADIWRRESQG